MLYVARRTFVVGATGYTVHVDEVVEFDGEYVTLRGFGSTIKSVGFRSCISQGWVEALPSQGPSAWALIAGDYLDAV